jgi:hypothetical protein
MKDLKIEYIYIYMLKEYENNAKKHPVEQIKQIEDSIKQFGMIDPIGVWKDNTIIEGHGRYLACKNLGIEQVPIIRLDKLSDEERKAYTLVHNKLTMNSDFDLDILSEELENIDIDLSDYGFENINLEENEIERQDLSDKEFSKYEIIIKCNDELDLQKKYEKLIEEGFECTISTL